MVSALHLSACQKQSEVQSERQSEGQSEAQSEVQYPHLSARRHEGRRERREEEFERAAAQPAKQEASDVCGLHESRWSPCQVTCKAGGRLVGWHAEASGSGERERRVIRAAPWCVRANGGPAFERCQGARSSMLIA